MQTQARVCLEPVTARRVSSVDHDDLGAGRADQQVGECHPGRAASEDEVVRLGASLRHGTRDFITRARENQGAIQARCDGSTSAVLNSSA
jgi:hypothetical protein